MVLIIGTFELDSSEMAEATRLAEGLVEPTLREPGCQRYGCSIDVTHPSRLLLMECWESQAALAAHLRQPHTQAFLRDFRQLRIQKRQVREYQVSTSGEFNPAQYLG